MSMLYMRGQVYAGFFVVTSYPYNKHNGFRHIVAMHCNLPTPLLILQRV